MLNRWTPSATTNTPRTPRNPPTQPPKPVEDEALIFAQDAAKCTPTSSKPPYKSWGAIGYSWLDGLLRHPWSGVQTPQVLGYSGMRVAEPLVGGSNPYGARVTLCGGGLGPHMSNQGTPWRRFPGIMVKNHPTVTGQDTQDWTPPGVHHTCPIG
jgi:hypothetical protein